MKRIIVLYVVVMALLGVTLTTALVVLWCERGDLRERVGTLEEGRAGEEEARDCR